MAVLRVQVHVTTYLTDQADPTDSWSRDSTAGHVSGVEVFHDPTQSADKSRYSNERFDVEGIGPGDVVHVVVADYESGDTFGRSGGESQVLGVFSREDLAQAYALSEAAAAVPKSQFEFQCNGKTYWASWTGYFEILQDVRVWSVVVQAASR